MYVFGGFRFHSVKAYSVEAKRVLNIVIICLFRQITSIIKRLYHHKCEYTMLEYTVFSVHDKKPTDEVAENEKVAEGGET